ncbi:hypothetical protein B0T19DRAFT_421816 [Cercophora scortea]|uniref:Uncharacterized protein n=1 Tax=Cercophora scortea TaxID=314031 RepID=A0AAE0ILU6_9PEZI|nr:hypothetical protein B0T19DRAFT_421816 [Cercophora scortea]
MRVLDFVGAWLLVRFYLLMLILESVPRLLNYLVWLLLIRCAVTLDAGSVYGNRPEVNLTLTPFSHIIYPIGDDDS